jgi:hypothetical protein
LRAFAAEQALPPDVRGPVDWSQGRQARMAAACRARRWGDQPLWKGCARRLGAAGNVRCKPLIMKQNSTRQ